VDKEVAAAILGVQVNGSLPADEVERLGGDRRDRRVLRVMGIAAPAYVQEQAILQRFHAQGRSPSIYNDWRGAKAA
jgi:hypothetical protein